MKALGDLVAELTKLIQQNQTLEAMERFYANDVTMQKNEQPPRIGKSVCLEHERRRNKELIQSEKFYYNRIVRVE